MGMCNLLVTSEYEGERVDKVIAAKADTLSRSFVQKIIKDGEVTVNGKVVKAGFRNEIYKMLQEMYNFHFYF